MKDEFYILRPVLMACATGMMIWLVVASCRQAAFARAQCEAASSSGNMKGKPDVCRVFTPQSLPCLHPETVMPGAD